MRARQVSAMFDVPATDKCRLEWKLDFPIEQQPWNVGLVVGPSGSGKSSVMKHVWGEMPKLSWTGASVVDDFAKSLSISDITNACSSVGFNTIPAWLRPFHVLSNGEQFRVDLARRMLELEGDIVVDEFTSVVDRQVAQVGSHAIQKYARKAGKKFVAVTCHYDVIEWLQPDWVLDMATRSFTRRVLQRRPPIEVTIKRVPYETWHTFAPFHYLTGDLNKSARCFALCVNDRPVSFAGVLHFPHSVIKNQKNLSRLVTLPDWQGLGLAMILSEKIGAAYKALDCRFRTFPAHPALIRSFDVSPAWKMTKRGGTIAGVSSRAGGKSTLAKGAGMGGDRPCATFEYCGPAMDNSTAESLIAS